MSGYFDLSGKVAVVTGGSRGLGRVMALGFAELGADVVAPAAAYNLFRHAAIVQGIVGRARDGAAAAANANLLETRVPIPARAA